VSRLDALFAERAARGRKVLVAYLCVGDPSVDESLAIARAALDAGADILELGMPFSDPSADGPAIARASERAIRAGGGIDATLKVARALREVSDAPLVAFGYYNPIFVRGEARTIADVAACGVDALLIVDLPIEEAGPLRAEAARRGVAIVPLLAPTSSPARVAAAKSAAAQWPVGFAYYVSVAGVTGSAALDADAASRRATTLRRELGVPVVVGFGVDSREKARAAAAGVDGVVVGTALVRCVEDGRSPDDRVSRVRALVSDLRAGLDA